ncbi:uncharacterized protein BYT42DRAFT_564612 [Radiomyces spectabilis]|uniref:uncharacterized protein n=1 Tax=Radiomyces spectabilis TaxID=64574 RepID=UPI00221F72A8|nr:uncharacterized protein BYT42DRAFT_564612 [Radiomyces spectabilis]KAI8380898.1 hypothetical protein BYT42DRAFT_564612 [Radiomyces spectabilis]
MFGGRPTRTSSASRQPTKVTDDLDFPDIDALLNAPLPAETDAMDDGTELDDPELLKQLQALTSPHGATAASKKRPVQKKNPVALPADLDLESYVTLAQEDGDDVYVELTEDDYNDPHLLTELSALSSAPEPVHNQPSARPPQSKKPTEAALQLMNMGFSQIQAMEALSMFDDDIERATNYLLDMPAEATTEAESVPATTTSNVPQTSNDMLVDVTSTPSDTVMKEPEQQQKELPDLSTPEQGEMGQDMDIVMELETLDPQQLKEKAQQYQKMALDAKRQGDKKKAVALLRHSKVLQQHYTDLNESLPTSTPTPEPIQPRSFTLPSPSQQQPPMLTESNSPIQEPSTSPAVTSPAATSPAETPTSAVPPINDQQVAALQKLLQQIIEKQKEYKEAALHYKELGNLVVAKQMIKTSKNLLQLGIQVKKGDITDIHEIEKNIPDKPDLHLGDGKMRHIKEFGPGACNQTFEQLGTQLSYQVDVCHNLSIQAGGRTSKGGKSMSDSCNLRFSQLEKAFAADLVWLRSYHDQTPDAPTPSLHFEQVDYTYRNILDHIPPNQLELKIIRGSGIQTLEVAHQVNPFVTYDFGGWPPENTAQAAMGKGETPVQKGVNPEFNFELQIPILRTNRLFVRYIQRKKLTLEVFHEKYSYGLFRRPISLGKVILPLDRLLTKCSISGWFDLVDANRKKTGGRLELQVNMREPLSSEDVVKRSERWLVIDAVQNDTSQLMAAAGLTAGPYQTPANTAVPSPSVTSNPASPSVAAAESDSSMTTPPSSAKQEIKAAAPEKSTAGKQTVSADTPELEQAEEELNSVESIVSNMVLEHEMRVVNTALSSKQSTKAEEDLMDRKQALEIKMNMLVIQVQTGILDMATYLKAVQTRMDRDRQLALLFKKHQRLDLAKIALTRKKIMQDELEEAEAAMAAGDGS